MSLSAFAIKEFEAKRRKCDLWTCECWWAQDVQTEFGL